MASTYLGIAFQPYVGQWTETPPQATTPPWNSYSLQDIVWMLEVIACSFHKISTYGMGYAGYCQTNTPWNQVDEKQQNARAGGQALHMTGQSFARLRAIPSSNNAKVRSGLLCSEKKVMSVKPTCYPLGTRPTAKK